MFHLPDEQILARFDQVGAFDPDTNPMCKLVTYKRFVRIDPALATREVWDDREVLCLTGGTKKFSTAANGQVVAQAINQRFIFREADLFAVNEDYPDGITFSDLSENDQIEFDGGSFGLKNHRYVAPFVRCEASGS